MKLTRRLALEITRELWEWLAETGKFKHEWKGWKKYGDMLSNCPLCEYAKQHDVEVYCLTCPLFGKWIARDKSICISEGSPFDLWLGADKIEERKRYAQMIVALCKTELKILDETEIR